jgi:hypothetical protein
MLSWYGQRLEQMTEGSDWTTRTEAGRVPERDRKSQRVLRLVVPGARRRHIQMLFATLNSRCCARLLIDDLMILSNFTTNLTLSAA